MVIRSRYRFLDVMDAGEVEDKGGSTYKRWISLIWNYPHNHRCVSLYVLFSHIWRLYIMLSYYLIRSLPNINICDSRFYCTGIFSLCVNVMGYLSRLCIKLNNYSDVNSFTWKPFWWFLLWVSFGDRLWVVSSRLISISNDVGEAVTMYPRDLPGMLTLWVGTTVPK